MYIEKVTPGAAARRLVAAIVERAVKDTRYVLAGAQGERKNLCQTFACLDAPGFLLSDAWPYVVGLLDLPPDFVAETRAIVLCLESPP